MPGYEQIESLKNCGSWGKFCWKTCGFERVNPASHISENLNTSRIHRQKVQTVLSPTDCLDKTSHNYATDSSTVAGRFNKTLS